MVIVMVEIITWKNADGTVEIVLNLLFLLLLVPPFLFPLCRSWYPFPLSYIFYGCEDESHLNEWVFLLYNIK